MAGNFCSWHTWEFSAYWLRKAGKDKLSEIKVVLIFPAGESTHLLQLILLRQEAAGIREILKTVRSPLNLKRATEELSVTYFSINHKDL